MSNFSGHIAEVLTGIGYDLKDYGKEYRTKPIYRDSDSDTVLRINKENGRFVDFARNISGSFEDLVKLSMELSSIEEAKEYVSNNFNTFSVTYAKPKIKEARILDADFLQDLEKDHSYWIKRGVSKETMEEFEGGVCKKGRMKNRYVFPVFNSRRKLVGVTGRYIFDIKSGAKTVKWKHLGDKYNWSYPLQINLKNLKKLRKIILVESIGDVLSLWEAGVQNTMVAFGIKISTAMLNTLLRLDPEDVVVAFNDDGRNNNAGNIAAKQAQNKLFKFFDSRQVRVSFPTKNDFGDMSKEEILSWHKKLYA